MIHLLKTKVLYVDDDLSNLDLFERVFGQEIQLYMAHSTHEAQLILQENEIHILIADQRMPDENGLDFINRIAEDFPFCAKVVLTAYSDRNVMRKAFQSNQIMDFILKPIEEEDMLEVFQRGRRLYDENLRQAKINQDYENLRRDLGQDHGEFGEIVGAHQGLRSLVKQVQKVATGTSNSTVLVHGESGTGKELVARAIHYNSDRKNGPFIAVNCAALPDTLWESELFGHEKGAFSNAMKRKLGRFELADKGTIFLDEIAEIPGSLQVKLLRVLQERCFERLGGTQTIRFDARIIAATNRNIKEEVNQGRFREDLFFRINVVPIFVPPLREHPEDIPELIDHFLIRANRKTGKNRTIHLETLSKLQSYRWPGNVRELENLVERAVILSDHEELNLCDFIIDLKTDQDDFTRPSNSSSVPSKGCLSRASSESLAREIDHEIARNVVGINSPESHHFGLTFRKKLKIEEIERYKMILRKAGGNISRAARILGIHRRTLTDRLRKMHLI